MSPLIRFQQHTIDSLVEKYSNQVDRNIEFYRKDEGYKFKAVETFKKEFNLNAKDFHVSPRIGGQTFKIQLKDEW